MNLRKFAKDHCDAMHRFMKEEGWSNEKGMGKVDPKELAAGIEIEREHSKDHAVQAKISRDHLSRAEIKSGGTSRYYSMLSEGERFVKAISTRSRSDQDRALDSLRKFVNKYCRET